MLVGSNKGVFLLVVDFWHMKPECWPGATKGEFNLARRKKRFCMKISDKKFFIYKYV